VGRPLGGRPGGDFGGPGPPTATRSALAVGNDGRNDGT